jgi:SAM-dependent methyltransferase
VIRIEIGRRNYLLYLVLPHRLKSRLLTPASRAKLDRINRAFNETIYSGAGASAYDQIHRYAEDEQHEYPARPLVAEVWPESGYGRALEVGAGSGYFTTLIARHAERVIALEPVADMQEVLKARCRAEGWIPYSRRLIRDPERRFRVERRIGRWPVFRHWAAVLAVEARRGSVGR